MKSVVITGVSSGIGYDAARLLIGHGFHVFGTVRREEDASRVRHELGDLLTPLVCDVADEYSIQSAADRVDSVVGDNGLAGLVNNAGIAVAGPLMHLPLTEIKHQFEVNFFGVISVTQAFLPLLGARIPCPYPPGRIVNISSFSGRNAFPFYGAYAASKHALEALSHAWRRELLIYGIDVLIIGPAAVKTPIWSKRGGITNDKFADTDYAVQLRRVDEMAESSDAGGMSVETVSLAILDALTGERPKVRYSLHNRIWQSILPYLPARLVDRLSARQFGLVRK